jgi:hypothetical protein
MEPTMPRLIILACIGLMLASCVAYAPGPYAYNGYADAAPPYGPHAGGGGGWTPMGN